MALGLDELLLLLLEQLRGDPHVALERLGEHAVQVDARQARRHLRQARERHVRHRRELLALQLVAHVLQALLLGGQGQLERRHIGVARQARRDVRQVLRQQHHGHVAREELRIVRPLLQRGHHEAILGRQVAHLPAGHQRLGEVDDERQRLALAQAQAQVVLQDLQRPGRVPRQALGVVRAVHGVVAGHGPLQVLLRLRRGGADARGAIIEDDMIPAAEQLVGEERAQGTEAARPLLEREGLQIPHGPVEQEGADGLRVVLLGQPAGPTGQLRERIRRLGLASLAHGHPSAPGGAWAPRPRAGAPVVKRQPTCSRGAD